MSNSLKGGSISFYLENTNCSGENIFFFIIISKIFTTQEIPKMENKHPEKFWSAYNSLSENKKNLIFEITLCFVKFNSGIKLLYVDFFRDI